eukprot:2174047-Prorocentrum_lima.AAC.1
MLNSPEWEHQPPGRLTHLQSQITRTPGSISSIHAPGTRRPRLSLAEQRSHCYAVCKNFGHAPLGHQE